MQNNFNNPNFQNNQYQNQFHQQPPLNQNPYPSHQNFPAKPPIKITPLTTVLLLIPTIIILIFLISPISINYSNLFLDYDYDSYSDQSSYNDSSQNQKQYYSFKSDDITFSVPYFYYMKYQNKNYLAIDVSVLNESTTALAITDSDFYIMLDNQTLEPVQKHNRGFNSFNKTVLIQNDYVSKTLLFDVSNVPDIPDELPLTFDSSLNFTIYVKEQ